jgi:hypothetical protein
MTFREFLRSFRSTWGALSVVAIAVVSILKFTPLVPPWPDQAGVGATLLAALACFVGVALGFYAPTSSTRARRRWGVISLLLASAILLVYLHLLSLRVVDFNQVIGDEQVTQRILIGTQTVNKDDANRSPAELIELYGVDGRAWTHRSLSNARICLLSTYMSFFLLLTFGFGTLQGLRREDR